VYQTIYDSKPQATLNPALLVPITAEMKTVRFELETLTPYHATYRDGDRYVTFSVIEGDLTVRLGVGSHDLTQQTINSMRLDEMIAFLFGSLKRGCHAIDDAGLQNCLKGAMKDIREFANEFLNGDFRPFLRVLSMKHREERAAAKAKEDLSKQVYLA
jgi:hypothetical protein